MVQQPQYTVKTRIQLKYDTEAHWNKAKNFCPLKGELIIYSTDEAHPFSRLKVGDGMTNVINLPFVGAIDLDGNIMKVATTAEWNSQITFIPKAGEIIVYSDRQRLDNNSTICGVKIGDGNAYCIDLPFVGDDIANALLEHIDNQVVHITQEERNRWNNKINCNDEVLNENLILTRL